MGCGYPFWIKERHNPQLGVYYVGMGQMGVRAAKRYESAMYGTDYMHRFDTEDAYKARLQELKANGERVQ